MHWQKAKRWEGPAPRPHPAPGPAPRPDLESPVMQPLRVALACALALLVWSLAPAGPEAPPGPASGRRLRLVCLGDSLTGGHGVPRDLAYPARVAAALGARGLPVEVVNAGVSGETAAQGLARLPGLLEPPPDLLLVELGANDGLRRRPLPELRRALETIVTSARARGVPVALAGMRLPPGWTDPAYAAAFAAEFPALAERLDVPLFPFLLEGVAGKPALNQRDGLHPNAEGQAVIAAGLVDFLEPLLRAR